MPIKFLIVLDGLPRAFHKVCTQLRAMILKVKRSNCLRAYCEPATTDRSNLTQ